ncbi:MAG: DUF6512 family protein [Candidatus Heimdallarchaeota archaeon]
MNTRVEDVEEVDSDRKLKIEMIIWHVAGWAVLYGLGTLFHFMYDWIQWPPIGWLFPVSESMWEHTKLGFWPAILLYGIEFGFYGRKVKKFIIAKVEAIFVSIIAMLAFYYTVQGAFGVAGWGLSMGTFAFATILQQITSYIIMNIQFEIDDKKLKILNIIALVSLGILTVMMILFTYIVPNLPIFIPQVPS